VCYVSLIGLLQDRPVQQFGANQDDLYIVGGTPWGLVNYMLTELSSHGTATFSKKKQMKYKKNLRIGPDQRFRLLLPDDPMVTQFLLTHQSFVSSVEVLRMLEE
jgi:hypothetical protein